MVTYPIHVSRTYYRGANVKNRREVTVENQVKAELEAAINKLLLDQKEPIKVYGWAEVSKATGHSIKTIADYCYCIDGGSNGFTAWRHDMTYEQAMAAHSSTT